MLRNMNYLRLGRTYRNEAGAEGSADGGGATPTDKISEALNSANQSKQEETPSAETKTEEQPANQSNETKLSDSEAKLLKEVMERKEKEQKAKAEAAALKEELAKFKDINLEEVQKLLAAQKEAETKRLEQEGAWDKLKKQMNDEQAKALQERDAKIAELEKALKDKESSIGKLTLGNSFGNSKYIAENVSLPASKVKVLFGEHFEIEGDKIVAYDKPAGDPNRTKLIDGTGEPLDFESAIQRIIEADADKDSLIKSRKARGADSSTNNAPPAPPAPVQLSGVDKIAAGLSSRK